MKKYKYVVVAGCSYSASDDIGYLVNPGETYGDLVANYYGAELYNFSRSGHSLHYMNRVILDWCSRNKDKFKDTLIIFGITEPDRMEFWSNKEDRWQAGYWWTNKAKRKANTFVKKWYKYFHNAKAQFYEATNMILGLQSFFKVNDIDHIFFDGLISFDEYWELVCDDEEDKLGHKLLFDNLVSKENWYIHPEYVSMCKLLEDNPEMRIFPKDCHPNKKAHKYWAECLLEYINDKKV
jgi:hypothetical protein